MFTFFFLENQKIIEQLNFFFLNSRVFLINEK